MDKTRELFSKAGLKLENEDSKYNYAKFLMKENEIKPAMDKLFELLKDKSFTIYGRGKEKYKIVGVSALKQKKIGDKIAFDTYMIVQNEKGAWLQVSDFDWPTGLEDDVFVAYASRWNSKYGVVIESNIKD